MTDNSFNDPKDSVVEKPQTLLKKLKSVKHLEIIVAFVIALVAIFIYFITTNVGASDTATVHTSSVATNLAVKLQACYATLREWAIATY